MLTFADLEQALKPISQIGMDEIQFEARGDVVFLRPIRPHEEVVVARYAREALVDVPAGEEPDQPTGMDYINHYKVMTLSFAIVQINDLDLRGEAYITMPETTESGRAIRVPKHIALRDLITRLWSPTLIRTAHSKYAQLLTSIAKEYVDLVETSPSDLDTEIGRLEEQLVRLRAERGARATGDSNIPKDDIQKLFTPPPAPRTPPTPTPRAAVVEPEPEPVVLDRMPTALDYNDRDDFDDFDDFDEEQLQEPPLPERAPEPVPVLQDSFGDADDPDVFAAEEARVLAARRAAQAQMRAARTEQSIATRSPRRTPPHMKGRGGGLSGGDVGLASDEELAAMGIPPNMVRETQDPEILSPRGRRHRQAESAPEVNPGTNTHSRNRRFVPAGGKRRGD